jgi:predicted phage terminase large subunit-like protein
VKPLVAPSVVSLPTAPLASFYDDLIADLAQTYNSSLRAFWQAMWPVLEPSRDLIWNWHLDVLCEVLEDVAAKKRNGVASNVVLNLPPGVGKSVGISVVFPCWLWASDPSLKFQTFSYSRDNTVRDNRSARTIVTSEWFNTYFWSRYRQPRTGKLRPVTLSADQAGKIRFDNTERGWRIASSVEGQGTGDHGDYILMDDLVKAKDARYPNALTYANTWLDETISTRWSLDPVKILVMQRLSLFDATAHVLEKAPGQWDHVVLPMRFRKSVAPNPDGSPGRLYSCPCHAHEPDKRDRRTVEGELLWPERFPEEKVKAAELELGSFGAQGQLQQEPIPPGGALFKRADFKFVDAAPINALRCRGWDTADTEGGGNWTVGVKLAVTPDGSIYIEHAERARSGPGGVNALIESTAETDGKRVLIREGSGSGKATIAARTKLLAGYDYAAMPETVATGDKVARSNPFRAQCQAGNVYVVREEWNSAYLAVMCNFTGVGEEDDDDVDATSNAYNGLVVAPERKRVVVGVVSRPNR